MPAAPTSHRAPALTWDVFCHVVDNLGDIGVCWRLCADLAARGHSVRLWIDAPDALRWMAPGALEGCIQGVCVLHWTTPLAPDLLAGLPLADVWIETFGCHPPPELQEHRASAIAAGAPLPAWINLEYMSAERYVERSHRLPSRVSGGPLRGAGQWFFYPGFTPATGGLLREPDLTARQTAFDARVWLASQGLRHTDRPRASLFCYEPAALPMLLQQVGGDAPSDWLVTTGRANEAVDAALAQGLDTGRAALHRLPRLTQRDYDHLLWSCDLNFVRGEDSLVRTLWAGQPFVWHIYPQHDNAHHAKLEAFLDWLQAPPSLREFHRAWNGMGLPDGSTIWPGWAVVHGWRTCVQAARARLLAQPDLTTQLLRFVAEKR
ncbi:MAG: elongation factor P maturation arginine rhamnosyltransferase EarP [Comamonadaceae bacterium]|nr:elongation factor P maturation arginine rhamnosyltransferase EarP [Comamonadaceae bacterium]